MLLRSHRNDVGYYERPFMRSAHANPSEYTEQERMTPFMPMRESRAQVITGRAHPWKRLGVFLPAFSSFTAEDFRCVVAGPRPAATHRQNRSRGTAGDCPGAPGPPLSDERISRVTISQVPSQPACRMASGTSREISDCLCRPRPR